MRPFRAHFTLIYILNRNLYKLNEGLVPDRGSLITEKIYRSSRNGGKAEVYSLALNRVLVSGKVIVYDARNGVKSVAGLCLEGAVLARLRSLGLLVDLIHFISVSVIRGNDSGAMKLVDYLEDSRKLKIKSLHGALGSEERARVTYHITVGEINAEVLIFTGLKALNELVGDLCALHPRSLLKGNDVRGDLDIGLELLGELTGLVSVPEIGYVSVLLSLGDGKLLNTDCAEILCHSVGDLGRVYKES